MRKLFCSFLLLSLFTLTLHAQNMQQRVKLTAGDRAPSTSFGNAVAISGRYAIAGAANESRNAFGGGLLHHAGAAYMFERKSNGWTQVQKLVAADRTELAAFGISVSINGDYAMVGAPIDSLQAGAAYIFERNSTGTWVQVQKLTADTRGANELFGQAVCISGNYAIVGAEWEDDDASGANPLTNAGAAYIYERQSNNKWALVKKIVAGDRGEQDYFGFSVAINGNYAAVGAYWDDEDANGANPLGDAGSVYFFERVSGNWQQVQKVTPDTRAAQDYFGFSVAMSGDRALIGAYLEDENAEESNTLYNSGSAYLFKRDNSGTWTQEQKLVSTDRQVNDYFGFSVALNGNQALVGAGWEDEDAGGANTLIEAGSAYLFEPNDTGHWQQVQKLTANDRFVEDVFGYSVGISQGVAFIGAMMEDQDANGINELDASGSAYIFCQNTFSVTDTSACGSFRWNDSTYTVSGTYIDTIPNTAGCDSIITLNLTVNTVNTGVLVNGNTLTAQEIDARYQWMRCSGSLLPGDTIQQFAADSSGSYAVIISKNGCTDTSACYPLTLAGIIYHTFSNFSVYPNPTAGNLNIQLGAAYTHIRAMISDASGHDVARRDMPSGDMLSLDIPGPAGIYFVELTTFEGAKARIKVVKQ